MPSFDQVTIPKLPLRNPSTFGPGNGASECPSKRSTVALSAYPTAGGESNTVDFAAIVGVAENLAPLSVPVINAQTVRPVKPCRQIAAVGREREVVSDLRKSRNPCGHFAGVRFEQIGHIWFGRPRCPPAGSDESAVGAYRDRIDFSSVVRPSRHADGPQQFPVAQ